jgi:curved DNA-binding protein CbpA
MDEFVDYYEMLQVSPTAEQATIQRVYRMLASRFHPDNPVTGSVDRFVALQQAYSVLSDAERRAAYDEDYKLRHVAPLPVFQREEFLVGFEAEANQRLGIVSLLYNQRRDDPAHPGISIFDLESMMSIPREHLEFSAWYLREKGYVRRDDHGDLTITAEGVDYVEERRRDTPLLQRLLTPGHNT